MSVLFHPNFIGAGLTGVEIDDLPHIRRRNCSPVIPLLCNSRMVTFPTLYNENCLSVKVN